VNPAGRGSAAAPEPFPAPAQAFFVVSLALVVRTAAALLFSALLPPGPSVLGMSAIVGLGAAFAWGASQLPVAAAAHLGLRRPPARVALTVPLLVPWLLLVSELDNVARGLLPALPDPPVTGAAPSGPLWVAELVLTLAVAVPVCGELLFRGLLQPGLTARLGRARGIALVCALDALVVLPVLEPRAMLFAASLSLPLCLLRDASGSLWPALALRIGFGAITVAAELGAFGIPGFDDTSAAHTPLRWLAPAAGSALAGVAICLLALRRARPAR
jgi:membrane protease YdiL (CAAX protease family)